MCGIVGFIDLKNKIGSAESVLARMCANLNHRGPDGTGFWSDDHLHLGHLRLSILDLSTVANQPMISASGRYVIVFNGEIYNYLDLKKELLDAGSSFKTTSDTEVILAAVEAWGIEKTLDKLAGMFAFALWDKASRKLMLARDRAGEKPLYYGVVNNIFFFCSELKALNGITALETTIDEVSVAEFFRNSCVPAPRSIFKNVFKLLPATYLEISYDGIDSALINPGSARRYWNYAPAENQYESMEDATDKLEILLKQVVSQQMLSDVPLGAFLSGGVDSSLIVGIMQSISSQPVNTFSIGFEDERFNEAPYAKKVAEHFGCSHHEYIFTNKELENIATSVPLMFDEPFGDSSQLPTYLVAKFARSKVTVSLSGDGGDEVFGGYNKYIRGMQVSQQLGKIPAVATPLLKLLRPVKSLLKDNNSGKLSALLRMENIHDEKALYDVLSQNDISDKLLKFTARTPKTALGDPFAVGFSDISIQENFMYWDFKTYLPNDILVKVDRMAMAVSLETRAPLLDKRVVEFMLAADKKYKIDYPQLKVLPRTLLKRYVPEQLINRPKKGFSIPLKSWFAATDNKFIDHVFNDLGKNNPYVDHDYALALLKQHRQGKVDQGSTLWNIYVWYLWFSALDRKNPI